MRRVQNRKSATSFFILAIPLSVILVALAISILVIYLVYSNYRSWEQSFEDSFLNTDIVLVPNEQYDEDIDKSIQEFINKKGVVEFIELDNSQISYMISKSLNESLGDRISVDGSLWKYDNNILYTYHRVSLFDLISFWLNIQLTKDPGEGYDIYIPDIYIGEYSFNYYGLRNIVIQTNDGLKDTLDLIIYNDFSSRIIINIEISEQILVIRTKLR